MYCASTKWSWPHAGASAPALLSVGVGRAKARASSNSAGGWSIDCQTSRNTSRRWYAPAPQAPATLTKLLPDAVPRTRPAAARPRPRLRTEPLMPPLRPMCHEGWSGLTPYSSPRVGARRQVCRRRIMPIDSNILFCQFKPANLPAKK